MIKKKNQIHLLQKEKSAVIEENNKLKQDLEKQKYSMEVFKGEFNIRKEIFERTAKELNAIKQRNSLKNGDENKKDGIGTIIWKDGSKYQGQFKNNQMNGYGMIEYPEKNYYQGEIKKGKMEGYGQFFWSDRKKYIGYYKNDKRNGFGVYFIIFFTI